MTNEDRVFTGTIHIFGKENNEVVDKVVDIDFPVLCKEWEQLTGYDEQDPNTSWDIISSTTKLDFEYTSDFSLNDANYFAREYNKYETQYEKDLFAEKVSQYMDNSHSLYSAIHEINIQSVKK